MSSLAFLRPMAACAITGLALYATRGVLDQTVTADGVVRFAMLPPWQALAGFIAFAGLILLGIDHLNAPRGTTAGRRPRLGELVLPLLGFGVLLLPYLPVLPDRWPALQVLAGPFGAIVWLAIAALQVWVLWQSRLITARPIARWTVTRLSAAILVATIAAAGFAASRLTSTPLFPAGDEPHYLVIAQSLWRDGDLKIENNHQRGDYREYYPNDLEPHYLTRGADGEIYSIHPVGIAVLLAPVYGAGGYAGVVAFLILMAAVAATIAWRWAAAALNAPGAATFAWAALALTAPYLLNSFTVYPEIAAGLAVMIAFAGTLSQGGAAPSLARWLAAAVAVAALPWLSTKYAPMSAALLLVLLARLGERKPAALVRDSRAQVVVVTYAISLAAWFAFFYVYWGTPLPMAPYGSLTQTSPLNLLAGGPGLLFDQEYGLLPLAPVYVLAFTGLAHLWRAGGALRRQAVEIAVVFGALLATVGAFGIWWGGTAAPSRPLASGLPLLLLPMAAAFRAAAAGSALRAGHHLLLWISAGIAATLVLAQDGLLINNGRDGSSALLEYWLPRWELWTVAPTFIAHHWAIAALHTAWWLALAALAVMVLSRARVAHAGVAALVAGGTLTAALLAGALTVPWLPGGADGQRVDLGARSRLAALDGFDARVRPAAMVYDPLRRGSSTEVLPRLTLGVQPQQRTDPQPLRVIHNGRFSLPAGTYRIDVTFGERGLDRPRPLALQIGRVGPPLDTWTVTAAPNERWSATLWLPVNASFVGLRGDTDIERAIDDIRITPETVVNAGARPLVPVVVAAARYGHASLFFHDDRMYPEADGFWTPGRRSVPVTVATPPGHTTPVRLRVHSGAAPNTVTFSTFGWSHTMSLVPGQAEEIELPMMTGGVIPLHIAAAGGFSPRDLDPAATDLRFLGAWIEVKDTP